MPAIHLYDRVPGSVGLGTGVFREHADVVEAALEVVAGCDCLQGCPACVGPVEEVGPLGKETAARVLAYLAAAPAQEELPPVLEGSEGDRTGHGRGELG